MDIAVAEIDITPEFPVPLFGFARRGTHVVTEIRDRLSLFGIGFREGPIEGFLLVFDLCVFDAATADRIYSILETQCHISRESVMLHTIHTHAGPVCSPGPIYMGDPEPYLQFLFPKIVTLMNTLRTGYHPDCRILVSQTTTAVPMNRRLPKGKEIRLEPNPKGETDAVMDVWQFRTAADEQLATIFRISCHPVSLGPIMAISTDYPGEARKALTAKGIVRPIFLQGAGGDANPNPKWDTVKLGQQAANEVARLLADPTGLRQIHPGGFRIWRSELVLPCEPTLPAHRTRTITVPPPPYLTEVPWSVHIFKFGPDTALIGLGCEPVHELALKIRHWLQPMHVLLLGYTGAYYTYIVTDRILKEDGYEASGIIQYTNLSGPLQAGVDRRIEQFFVEIRQKMGIFFSQ
jgi:hypothetical protein